MAEVTELLGAIVTEALDRAKADGLLEGEVPEPTFERPRRKDHGDWATNVALVASAGGNPRSLAEAIVERLPASDIVRSVEVAGPGFLNFHLSPRWLHDIVTRAATEGSGFGRSNIGNGEKVNVEYVSANPTGPVNVVSGRQAAVGDAISSLLEATGHEVTREFYVNDAGRQIELFGESVGARYLQLHGQDAAIPEEGYQGEYLVDLVKELSDGLGDELLNAPADERNKKLGRIALDTMLAQMSATLERFGTTFDVWFSERTLHEAGEVEAALEALRATGRVYENDGAVWFRSSDLGDDKDRVLVRSDGTPTYLSADAAYVLDKFGRGFERLLYLWGPDHHGSIVRFLAAVESLGLERDRVEVSIVQVVSLMRGGEAVKSSKRAGSIVPLEQLIDDVGPDAARYIFLQRSMEAPLDFDLDLAREQAPENPVFYVQYAHARICSILRKAADEGVAAVDATSAPLERLEHGSEDDLMRALATYEDVIPEAAYKRAPQRVTNYIEELASTFSSFYRDCKVVTEDADLTAARLALCVATKNVIADALSLLGVSAPERM
ncbi:MAG: arginine--tRNA ligase [Actinobacteria bacterium]|nr:arginine--tRNA ligase [Actinomycetota bacterium]